jgi:outer membrane protein OmpA-like peptidoglycan-associated protein
MTSLDLSDDTRDRPRGRKGVAVVVFLLLILLAGVGFLGYEGWRRTTAIDAQIAVLSERMDRATLASQQALERADAAHAAALAAAEGRQLAEAQTGQAQAEADTARKQAMSALETAAGAQAEMDRVQKQAEAELNRLQESLSQIAETRRTALGLVMNLNSDYLKFDFDKADLHPPDRELLSRIGGILMTSPDYTVSVNGHTDDVGTDEYNQKLSERRAQAVRDYLVKSGLPAGIFTVTGHGKKRPLVPGTTEKARAKNRRVELGIVNTKILYGRPGVTSGETRFTP